MPLPSPNSSEDKDSFISRCVSELHDKNEFSSQDQRLAVCYSRWEDKKESSTIEIVKEFQIPGTDMILEKGDKIFILKA